MKITPQYIAGFFDGEGCICISKLSSLRCVLTNTNLPILKNIQKYLNLGKITQKKDIKTKRNKLCFQLVLWNRDAEIFLKNYKNKLIVKKDQVLIALEFQKTIRLKGSYEAKNLSQKVWIQRDKLNNRLKKAKKI